MLGHSFCSATTQMSLEQGSPRAASITCRRGAGNDCGWGRGGMCEMGLSGAAGYCGILVCISSPCWADVCGDADLH